MAPEPAASLLWPATVSDVERSSRLLVTRAAHCAPHTTLHAWAGSIWPSTAEDCSEIDAATYVLQFIQILLHWSGEHVAAPDLHATMN